LTLKGNIVVRNLDDAARFMIGYQEVRRPGGQYDWTILLQVSSDYAIGTGIRQPYCFGVVGTQCSFGRYEGITGTRSLRLSTGMCRWGRF
jgi:hypothetical protein